MPYTTIKKPSDYFNTKLYTGNGSTQSITGLNFQPDWSWFKVRSEIGSHRLVDSVRGNTKYLFSNATDAEATDTNNVTSFDSDGFSLGNGSINESARTYASWNWLASNTTASNTDGSITSTVSANTTSGFSIVKVSKPNTNTATIGHGLGATPKFIIGKDLDTADNWTCYHESLGNGKGIYLNANNAETSASTFWNSTSPTSSVFSIGSDNTWNSPSILFFCFAEKQGFSKFGSYVGNGNADGPFVYTGFKPAFVMIKMTSTADNWIIQDNKRNPSNISTSERLRANSSGAEFSSVNPIDLYSNGFKAMSGSDGEFNGLGSSYIYMAFAEEPLVGDNPATAR